MDSRVPKNEREWWAAREIGRLRDKLVMGLPSEDDLAFLLWCESRHLTAAERSSPYWLECWEHESDPKREIGDEKYWPRSAARAVIALLRTPTLTQPKEPAAS